MNTFPFDLIGSPLPNLNVWLDSFLRIFNNSSSLRVSKKQFSHVIPATVLEHPLSITAQPSVSPKNHFKLLSSTVS